MPKSVVLDTNVVVSAHLKAEGVEWFVFTMALKGDLKLFVSAPILEEYRDVLKRKRLRLSLERVEASLKYIEAHATHCEPKRTVLAAGDPEDNKFLECAQEVGADFLVTANKRHFPRAWGTTRVVNARELLEIIIPELKR